MGTKAGGRAKAGCSAEGSLRREEFPRGTSEALTPDQHWYDKLNSEEGMRQWGRVGGGDGTGRRLTQTINVFSIPGSSR